METLIAIFSVKTYWIELKFKGIFIQVSLNILACIGRALFLGRGSVMTASHYGVDQVDSEVNSQSRNAQSWTVLKACLQRPTVAPKGIQRSSLRVETWSSQHRDNPIEDGHWPARTEQSETALNSHLPEHREPTIITSHALELCEPTIRSILYLKPINSLYILPFSEQTVFHQAETLHWSIRVTSLIKTWYRHEAQTKWSRIILWRKEMKFNRFWRKFLRTFK